MIDSYIQLAWTRAGVAEHVQVAWCWNILQEHFNWESTGKSQVWIFFPITASFAFPALDVFVFSTVSPKRRSKARVWGGAHPRTLRKTLKQYVSLPLNTRNATSVGTRALFSAGWGSDTSEPAFLAWSSSHFVIRPASILLLISEVLALQMW